MFFVSYVAFMGERTVIRSHNVSHGLSLKSRRTKKMKTGNVANESLIWNELFFKHRYTFFRYSNCLYEFLFQLLWMDFLQGFVLRA